MVRAGLPESCGLGLCGSGLSWWCRDCGRLPSGQPLAAEGDQTTQTLPVSLTVIMPIFYFFIELITFKNHSLHSLI